jgi:ATP-dependent Clp protease protease subunit
MMHQPSQSGAVEGVAADIEIRAKEILYMRAKMFELLARHAGQPLERIERDFDRDRWMAAPDAQRYGLIDAVVETRVTVAEPTGSVATNR